MLLHMRKATWPTSTALSALKVWSVCRKITWRETIKDHTTTLIKLEEWCQEAVQVEVVVGHQEMEEQVQVKVQNQEDQEEGVEDQKVQEEEVEDQQVEGYNESDIKGDNCEETIPILRLWITL